MQKDNLIHDNNSGKKSLSVLFSELLAQSEAGTDEHSRLVAFAKTIDKYEKRCEFKKERILTDKRITVRLLDQTIENLSERSRELERKEASLAATVEKLKSANDDMQHFMHVASHDLKTPLRSIGSFSNLITRRLGDHIDEEIAEYFGFITRSAQSMNRVIDDLVRFNNAAESENLEEVNVAEVAEEVVHNLHADILDSGANVTLGKLEKTIASRSSVSQLLQNLIRNAIVYRDLSRPLQISVRCTEIDGKKVLAIQDNGVGLSNDYQEKAFLPFKRVGDITKPGTGMGLAICRRIARKMGGDIWYDGQVGKGTTFYVSFTNSPHQHEGEVDGTQEVKPRQFEPSC